MHLDSSVPTGMQAKAHPGRFVSAHVYCISYKRASVHIDQRVLFCFSLPGNKSISTDTKSITYC